MMAVPAAVTNIAGRLCAHNRATAAGSIIKPTAINVPSAWKPATRLSTTRNRKRKWYAEPRPRDGAKEARIEALRDERPINQRQHDESERGYAANEIKRRVVDSEDSAEQYVQEIDVRAAQRNNENAERQ